VEFEFGDGGFGDGEFQHPDMPMNRSIQASDWPRKYPILKSFLD